ncbi:uncharacterized protein BO97DRAFT_410995 [Aspergillus homomorphus CBS 101889]|uniref:Uncharacterized protein n=1 Tax=Aspergillus homomorphus (strain CBS 101889) TaxID=1450537 RepID=A0A395I8N2_ASPHC|nr:hypothetical protein BO97DRAFT_410995 [Aspergillus homomorphus CBS 101889]RAL16630.1 hypothetical protein BO97DRAFT_410995 [Aspergillus homomorphus CBS 101889]
MRQFISFPLASGVLFSIIGFALGAVTLSDYLNQRNYLLHIVPKAEVHYLVYVAAVSYNTCASCFSFLVLGLILVIHITRRDVDRRIPIAAVFLTGVLGLANALTMTIITATKTVSFGDSVGPHVTTYLDEAADSDGVPLLYRNDSAAIATVVFAWLGWLSSIAECVLLHLSLKTTTERQQSMDFEGDKTTWSQHSIKHDEA